MKKIFLLLMIWVIASCSGDTIEVPGDFTGTDNYITSFSLTKDGITYPAVISGNRITVTVRHDVSLDGAKAEVVLSENSSISPNPSGITAWDEEWRFMTTSFNKQDKVYSYSVEYADESSAGNVILTTQEEVDAFAGNGINVIDGNLTIGTDSPVAPITSLEGLADVTRVSGNLIVKGSYEGNSLEEMASLESVGGIYIGNEVSVSLNQKLTAITLPLLAEVKGNVVISSNVAENVSFPALKSVGGTMSLKSDNLLSLNMPELEYVAHDMILHGSTKATADSDCEYLDFASLKEVGGNVEFGYFANVFGLSFGVLDKVSDIKLISCSSLLGLSMPVLAKAENISVSTCTKMVTFIMPVIHTIESLKIADTAVLESIDMPELVAINGDFSLSGAKTFQNVNMGALKTVGGNINFSTLVNSNGIIGMTSLESVGGNLTLAEVGGMETLDLSGVSFPNGNISVSGASFNNLTLLKGPQYCKGDVVLKGGKTLTSLPVIEGFNRVGGKFSMDTFASVANAIVVKDLKTVGGQLYTTSVGKTDANFTGEFYISYPSLESVGSLSHNFTKGVDAYWPELLTIGTPETNTAINLTLNFGYNRKEISFPKLQTIYGSAKIAVSTTSDTNAFLEEVSFPKLAKVDGNLELSNTKSNAKVEKLDLSALRELTGKLTLKGMPKLVDFTQFRELVDNIGSTQWDVTLCGYNPTYEDMKEGKYTETIK